MENEIKENTELEIPLIAAAPAAPAALISVPNNQIGLSQSDYP